MSNPSGWMVEISGADKFFYSEKSALNARRRYEREMDAEEGVKPYAVYAAAPVSPIAGVRWTYHGSEPQAELVWFSAGEVAPGGDVTHELYASAIPSEPEEGDHDGRQLEWERAENKRLKTMADNYCALLMDANAKLAERDALFADVLSIDVPRTAKALEQMRSILSANEEAPSHGE